MKVIIFNFLQVMAADCLSAKLVSLIDAVSLKDNAEKLTEFSNFKKYFSKAVLHVNHLIK